MRLLIKRLSVLLLIGFLLVFSFGFILPYIGSILNIYEITDVLVTGKSFFIILFIAVHFAITAFIINKIKVLREWKSIYVILFFTLLYVLITFFFRCLLGNKNFSFHIESVLILSLIAGVFYRNSKNKIQRFLSLGFIFGLLVLTDFYIIPLTEQHNLHQNYTGTASKKIDLNVQIKDNKGNNYSLSEKDKLYVIDFWNNGCYVCFEKFPYLKKLQNKYQQNDGVEILAVNVYQDSSTIAKSEKLLLKTDNGDLNNFYIDEKSVEIFDLKWFPKTIVLKNNEIIFEGNIETLLIFERKFLKK